MRAWERVTYLERCGYCGAELKAGQPMQTIARHGLKRKLIRCPTCADGDVPPDLPARPERLSLQTGMVPIQSAMPERTRGGLRRRVNELANEPPREWMPFREPGEDD